MSEELRIDEDLYQEIESLKKDLTENIIKIGRLKIEMSMYEKDLELMKFQMGNLCEEAEKVRSREISLKKTLEEKYGPCEYNFETGTIKRI